MQVSINTNVNNLQPSQQRIVTSILACAFALLVSIAPQLAYAEKQSSAMKKPAPTVSLPLVTGWYKGQEVFYLQTEASDQAVAISQGVNYVPRLANVIPANGEPSGLDDIYVISGFIQNNIIPSAPSPTGPSNRDLDYTPLWQVSVVTWSTTAVAPHVLRSEAEVFAARDMGHVTINKTNIVVNCPVIYTPTGGLLQNTEIHGLPEMKSPFSR